MKNFYNLGAIEVARLTSEDIAYYAKETGDEGMVLLEVSRCRKKLDQMGIDYK